LIKGEFNNIGKIIKLSGHSGELIISSESISGASSPDKPVFVLLEGEYVPFFIEAFKPINAEKSVVRFEGVCTERKALRLTGKTIFEINGRKKKTGDTENIIGWEVFDVIRGYLGKIASVDLNAKNPLLIIDHSGTEILIPFQEEFISEVNKKEKKLLLNCPDGLIDLYLNHE